MTVEEVKQAILTMKPQVFDGHTYELILRLYARLHAAFGRNVEEDNHNQYRNIPYIKHPKLDALADKMQEDDITVPIVQSGWTILPDIHGDYYAWCEAFIAIKDDYIVFGNFTHRVHANTHEAYLAFIREVDTKLFDLGDI